MMKIFSGILSPTFSRRRKSTFSMSIRMKMICISLCILGWIMAIVACAFPMWRVIAFRDGIVAGQITWEGLWMSCVVSSTGQMWCKVCNFLPQDLQAARALTLISILLALLAVLIAIVGAKCTNCIKNESAKAKVMIVSGVLFIVSGVMELIPVSWSANTTSRDFYNLSLNDVKWMRLGAALYIGWASAALLILGGGLLCFSCPPREMKYDHLQKTKNETLLNPELAHPIKVQLCLDKELMEERELFNETCI